MPTLEGFARVVNGARPVEGRGIGEGADEPGMQVGLLAAGALLDLGHLIVLAHPCRLGVGVPRDSRDAGAALGAHTDSPEEPDCGEGVAGDDQRQRGQGAGLCHGTFHESLLAERVPQVHGDQSGADEEQGHDLGQLIGGFAPDVGEEDHRQHEGVGGDVEHRDVDAGDEQHEVDQVLLPEQHPQRNGHGEQRHVPARRGPAHPSRVVGEGQPGTRDGAVEHHCEASQDDDERGQADDLAHVPASSAATLPPPDATGLPHG